jgi:hypothetical protein
MDTLSPVVVTLIIGSSHAIHFVSMRLIVRIGKLLGTPGVH